MYRDLTRGPITKTILIFAIPMIAGNLLQQFYNIADTLIVGRFIGSNALAAVGSAYTLMVFLTSIFQGLSMGAGALFSIYFGQGDHIRLKASVIQAFLLIAAVTLILNLTVYLFLDFILGFLQVPDTVYPLMREYLLLIFAGMIAMFLYNFFSCLLRALGNSTAPLLFLIISAVLNILLDLLFVLVFRWGVQGAAAATVVSQSFAAVCISLYTIRKCPELRPSLGDLHWNRAMLREIGKFSVLTCMQQSVMNFGVLMIQGLVNSFGPIIMAAFAAAVKIDSFAYMPALDLGNAFSTFVAQNYGAGQYDRIRWGAKKIVAMTIVSCVVISAAVFLLAKPLMLLFIHPQETEILAAGVQYLRIEGAFYWGIGCLSLFYGFYRAVKKPAMSVVLTIVSLGTRVLLAYSLSGLLGVTIIWAAIPIGWVLADLVGYAYYRTTRVRIFASHQE